jgi:hypothetical protein
MPMGPGRPGSIAAAAANRCCWAASGPAAVGAGEPEGAVSGPGLAAGAADPAVHTARLDAPQPATAMVVATASASAAPRRGPPPPAARTAPQTGERITHNSRPRHQRVRNVVSMLDGTSVLPIQVAGTRTL